MKFRLTILLLLWGVSLFGCINEREGELTSHWISCEKSDIGKWVSVDQFIFNRFDIVHESNYQVSFTGQRVIPLSGLELKKCTVYDRNNWHCTGLNGSLVEFKDGKKTSMMSCSQTTGNCYPSVNYLNRLAILIRGVEETNRLCGVYSEAFEWHLNQRL